MAIDGGLRNKLAVGTRLVARYKGAEHTAEVVNGEEGKTRYRLANGREFKSPSAAGSARPGVQRLALLEPRGGTADGDREADPHRCADGRRRLTEGAPALRAVREVVCGGRAAGAPRGERRSALHGGVVARPLPLAGP